MKKKYEKMTCERIVFAAGEPLLVGSIGTVIKDFEVKTGDYELEDNNWYSDKQSISFD